MRITADIIDEEFFADSNISEKCSSKPEKKVKVYIHNTQVVPDRISQCQFQDMLKKFKMLTVSDQALSNRSNFSSDYSMALSSKEMDEVKGCPVPLDKEPTWLLPYFAKMKEEIKKEILEELMFGGRAGCSSQTLHSHKETDKSNEVVHEGIYCDHCDLLIRGIRYKCGNCSDFDLCQICENIPNIHNKNHIFLKIRYSVPLKVEKNVENSADEVSRMINIPEISNNLNIFQTSRKRKILLEKHCRILEAKFVRDETVPDGTVIEPSAKFIKSWRIMNSGTRSWTKDTKLRYLWGSKDLRPTLFEVDVPFLKAGEEGVVSVLFISPSKPGMYQSHWQFRHKNHSFGHFLWCNIKVEAENHEDKKQQQIEVHFSVNAIDESGSGVSHEKENKNQKKEVANIAQVLTAVKEEHDRGNMIPRKLVVTSHTATPTNTPFDLTPPKSPEPQETTVKEIQVPMSSNTEGPKLNNESDCEDEGSIQSLSSSESDTEFVIIPMPRCFNMSESFASSHLQQLSQQVWPAPVANENNMNKKDKTIEECEFSQCKKYSTSKTCFSETVSQETGVPEVSENIVIEAVVEVVENASSNSTQKNVIVSHLSVDESTSEISVIESDDSSPSIETLPPAIEEKIKNSAILCAHNECAPVKKSISPPSSDSSLSIVTLPPANEDKIKNSAIHCTLSECAPVKKSISSLPSDKPQKSGDLADKPQEACHIEDDATFPKFPVEGIEADLLIPKPEERTVQVLPEGLLTGTLSAAATLYNTAKAVISSIQHPRNEQEVCLSREFESTNQPEAGEPEIPHPRDLDPMQQLIEMGFCNRQLNEQYLQKYKGDLALVVADLVNLNDNDWYASRHNQAPCTNFD